MITLVGVLTPVSASLQTPPLVARLTASDIATRMDAVTELEQKTAADPHVLEDMAVQKAVVMLVEVENARIAKNMASFLKTGKTGLDEDRCGSHWSRLTIKTGIACRTSDRRRKAWRSGDKDGRSEIMSYPCYVS
jgi:hypothetical protein